MMGEAVCYCKADFYQGNPIFLTVAKLSKNAAVVFKTASTRVMGTFSYVDPEYFQSNQFTDKSDVHSFGAVLVELISGQKAILSTEDEEGGLVPWFLSSMENSTWTSILDARLLREVVEEEIIIVANLANRCLNLDGRRRPTMKEVAAELETIRSAQHGLTRRPSSLVNECDEPPLAIALSGAM